MRLLFITSNRIGDAILSTGLLGHLVDTHPGIRTTVVCGPAAAGLFGGVPGLQRVLVLRKRRLSFHWLDMLYQCLGTRWDIVVNLRRAPLAALLPARRHHTLPPPDDSIPRVVHIAGTLGLDLPPAPRLFPTADAAARADALLAGHDAVLAVGPTANWGGKMWPAAKFAEAVTRLTGPGGALEGAAVLLAGGGGEAGLAAPVIDAVPPARRIVAFGGELAVTGECLRRCRLYLGNDSGLMHLAAAAGAPTLGLFGPSPDHLYAPWGEMTAVVRTPETFAELSADPRYDPLRQDTLMETLSVDSVVAAAEALLRRVRDAQPMAGTGS